ncbi:MAG TPA: M13 family metallopeptidase [Puia sp.]|nr:M13 family metallopeptidase [Puia sp.]
MAPMRSLLCIITVFILYSFLPPGKKRKFIDPANMDLSVRPGDNFYLYADGKWIKNNPVPASKTRWGSFDALRVESLARLRALLESAAAGAATDTKLAKIGDFYISGMDSTNLERLGYQPIVADLHRIEAITNTAGLLQEIAYEHTHAIAQPLVGIFISPDRKDVTHYIPEIGQGGISLPDRDYYLKNNARNTAVRAAYTRHVKKMFELIGRSDAQAAAATDAVMRIETALASAEMSRVEMRDPYKTYNKFSWKDLSATTPAIEWKSWAAQMQVTAGDSLVVSNPSFLKSMDLLLTAVSLDDWKAYLQWNVLRSSAPFLSDAFVKEDFEFNRVLTGQKVETPRWQRISGLIDRSLGDQLGQLYVEKYFTPAAKQRMQELVNNLQETFAARIRRVDWMSDETKQRAVEKLQAFLKKIGYPDTWKDYSSVTIRKDDLLQNVRNCGIWAYNDNVTDGNLKDWWTKADADNFKTRADQVVAQYNGFTVLDTLHVNGRLTLGENLADLGGLSIAYEAFTKTKEFKEGKKIDGFTPQQRFFLSWAQIWRSNTLPETSAQLILTDPHSPGLYRCNGPLSNIDAWYEAFDVKPGDKMYKAPDQRTRIW